MPGEKHWGLPGGEGLVSDLELWKYACCCVSSLSGMCPGTFLASSTLQTLHKSFRTYGVSGYYLSEKLGAGPEVMSEEFPSKKLQMANRHMEKRYPH